MPQETAAPPSRETGVDRFEHEIEELEKSFWRENRRQFLIAALIAVGAAVLLGAGFLLVGTLQQRTAPVGTTTIMTIELIEPRGGASLTARPTRFRWESIAKTKTYVFRIGEKGSERPLVERTTSSALVELTPEEASRIVKGGTYQWSVEARSSERWTIGRGENSFYY